MEASFGLGWHKQFRSNQHGGKSIALEWQVRFRPFVTAYQLIQQGHVKYTQVTMTQIQDSIDKKSAEGQAFRHAWIITIVKNKINEKINQTLIYVKWSKAGEVWVSVQRREDRRWSRQAVGILCSSPNPKRRVVTMTPTQFSRSLTFTHTQQRSIGVG